MKYRHQPPLRRRGYTLVEIMFTLGIMSMLMYGLLMFYQDSYTVLFTSEGKNLINKDIRGVTNELTEEARNANHFVIYESFDSDLRNVPPDALADDQMFYDPSGWTFDMVSDTEFDAGKFPLAEEDIPENFNPASFFRKRDGESGDFLLLITLGDDLVPYDTPDGAKYPHDQDYTKPITKLVGYFRSVENAADQTGPVRKFVVYPKGNDRFKPVEQLIPSSANAKSYPMVIELSKGLANKRLFYNYRDRSVMVNGQIYHGNDAKRVTDTYNFTISPRG